MIQRGARLTLDIEKPAAGGRMLARHSGQVVLVSGTIPGERVTAVIERVGKGVLFADTEEVVTASPDRRSGATDWRCGGSVFSHITYARQCELKAEIIRDAFTRIGRLPLARVPEVVGSPETGYRMRARLHVQGPRIGFFREGSHELCDPAPTGQLLPSTIEWIAAASDQLQRIALGAAGQPRRADLHGLPVTAIEIAENIPGDQRAVHFELQPGIDPTPYLKLFQGPVEVTDVIQVPGGATLTVRRDVRAFFQGNRFLLEPLVARVISLAEDGPIVDLYAGVGLFGLSLAAAGARHVTMIEGDRISGADLKRNAEPFSERVRVHQQSVETFLSTPHGGSPPAFIVDPPRTGMSREALAGIINHEPPRIVYVSCDVATLARDARTLVDAGYEVAEVTGIDLFPNTAHVETVVLFRRS
jgi:23S rRNA (uracil1939-C5)-methyltransferase